MIRFFLPWLIYGGIVYGIIFIFTNFIPKESDQISYKDCLKEKPLQVYINTHQAEADQYGCRLRASSDKLKRLIGLCINSRSEYVYFKEAKDVLIRACTWNTSYGINNKQGKAGGCVLGYFLPNFHGVHTLDPNDFQWTKKNLREEMFSCGFAY